MEKKYALLRKIPKIDELLLDERLIFAIQEIPRAVLVECARERTESLRTEIKNGTRDELPAREALIDGILECARDRSGRHLRKVINAAGVILHTNLGRANLCPAAVKAVCDIADSYSNLEYDVEAGRRGSRHDHIERIIRKITGAEAAMVVNNNAAATMLCLSALAAGKEVVVSRGELVEIGGSFRIPDIMAQSGAILREVGTTNKTHVTDYERAYDAERTGAFLKVHTSNYRIIGFTEEVTLPQMVKLGRKYDVPVIYDMGSGLLCDLSRYGVEEPTVSDALKAGVDLVLFSGDKLLGGPQGGILIGKRALIDQMKHHPLARVLRVDKMTLAGMEATFQQYMDMEAAKRQIPVLEMITVPQEELRKRAAELAELLRKETEGFLFTVVDCEDCVGGGAAPQTVLKGAAVEVTSETITCMDMERGLRAAAVPVIARIAHDKLLLSLRTIRQAEYAYVAEAFAGLNEKQGGIGCGM